jgi:hypothetical protein
MYTVSWHRYPNGIEGQSMTCKSKGFEDIEKAIDFLNKKANAIRGIYWAGGYVEDEKFNIIHEILAD